MDDTEIDRFASNIHFLREWRFFNYEPRVIRFTPETGCSNGAEAQSELTLSQFSAAEVPKCNMEAELGSDSLPSQSRKDFILYAGGLVWALDWCPRLDQEMVSDSNYEFLAVAAHPPDSTYHKLGAPLSGRGMVQIWCLLNYTSDEDVHFDGSTKQKYKKTAVGKKVDNKFGKPRGRPRKNPVNETPAVDPENHFTQDQLPDDALNTFHAVNESRSISTSQNELALVQLAEDALNTPHVEKDSQSIFVSQNMSAPIHENMQSQKHVKRKENITFTYKRRKRKPKERTIDEPSVDFLDSQFIPALAVRFPDASDVFSVDETLQSDNPIPMEQKWSKQNSVDNENTSVDETDVIHGSERSSYPERVTSYYPPEGELPSSSTTKLGKRRRIPTKKVIDYDLDLHSTIASLKRKSRKKSKIRKDPCSDFNGPSTLNKCGESSFSRLDENVLGEDGITSNGHVVGSSLTDLDSDSCHDKQNHIVPQAVLCLGHDGKVAWDVKWRPVGNKSVNKYRMGYLAVVLGNGYIEVWDIPSPEVVRRIYVSQQRKDTDPRFAKLKPVFKCSKVNYGDRLSMPLTVEWSSSPPHDLVLAGCHDGVVAVWKFSTEEQSEDARPLLCFSAETGPIRSLTWAPFDGDPESSHVIVTAGHGGLKFWDLRDPYRPLWDANPSQRYIYGLDWLSNPRCVLVSYDDGNLRTLSLLRSAYDVPVTGESFSGTLYQGLASYSCSSSAIWSIHVSRQTGIVAYCCADGAVLYYQLTHKAVDKDPSRNRAPHFLCGSLASEGLAVTLNTELPTSPYRMKKSATEWTNTPRSARTVSAGSNNGKRVRKREEKIPNPTEEVLNLCYGDDSETQELHETQNSTKSKKATNNQAIVSTDGEEVAANTSEKANIKDESRREVEEPPQKLQAMYRVRWNMNKGSERWLCYGGAAGIVRCQEIVVPAFDKKLLKR